MSKRTRVTCESCGSFLHETKDCNEKVLGFKERNGYRGKHFTGREKEAFWQVKEKDVVPVVSVEEYNKEIEKLRKHLDAVVAFRDKKFVEVEWLKKEIERITDKFEKDKYNCYGYEQGFDKLIETVEEKE